MAVLSSRAGLGQCNHSTLLCVAFCSAVDPVIGPSTFIFCVGQAQTWVRETQEVRVCLCCAEAVRVSCPVSVLRSGDDVGDGRNKRLGFVAETTTEIGLWLLVCACEKAGAAGHCSAGRKGRFNLLPARAVCWETCKGCCLL